MADEKPVEIRVAFPGHIRSSVYSNNMIVAHAREEFLLDFPMVAPPSGTVTARVVPSPGHVERLVAALQETLAKYEAAFGPIRAAEAPQGKIGISGMEPNRGGIRPHGRRGRTRAHRGTARSRRAGRPERAWNR